MKHLFFISVLGLFIQKSVYAQSHEYEDIRTSWTKALFGNSEIGASLNSIQADTLEKLVKEGFPLEKLSLISLFIDQKTDSLTGARLLEILKRIPLTTRSHLIFDSPYKYDLSGFKGELGELTIYDKGGIGNSSFRSFVSIGSLEINGEIPEQRNSLIMKAYDDLFLHEEIEVVYITLGKDDMLDYQGLRGLPKIHHLQINDSKLTSIPTYFTEFRSLTFFASDNCSIGDESVNQLLEMRDLKYIRITSYGECPKICHQLFKQHPSQLKKRTKVSNFSLSVYCVNGSDLCRAKHFRHRLKKHCKSIKQAFVNEESEHINGNNAWSDEEKKMKIEFLMENFIEPFSVKVTRAKTCIDQ